MNWSSSLAWLATLASRRDDGCGYTDTDRAGMGTAFGLDASFGVSAEAVCANGPAGAPQQALEPWERRIVRRSGL